VSDSDATRIDHALATAYRRERVAVLAALVRTSRGDVDAAEDALAEAIGRAVVSWRERGIPDNPGAWLLTVARRVLIDRARRQREVEAGADEGSTEMDDGSGGALPEDRLALLFTCCHPALSQPAQTALALRTIGGLTARQIADHFLETEATVAQRLVRAVRRVRDAGIAYEIPTPERRAGRVNIARQVLYLLFNQGYSAPHIAGESGGSPAEDAIAIARLLVTLDGEDSESRGILALMLVHHARRTTRVDASGAAIPLEEQDRSRWDRTMIAEGCAILEAALRTRRSGLYQVQAAIAALHATAVSSAATDWPQIAQLYAGMRFVWPSPVVELNAAAALAMVRGPEWGLAQLDALEEAPGMRRYPLLTAARADLQRRLGDPRAIATYRDALALTVRDADRRYLERRIREFAQPA
jgi:RNA polymerase sigma-70 factor, ECF subfamily